MPEFYRDLVEILSNADSLPDVRSDKIRDLLIQCLASGWKKQDLYTQMLVPQKSVAGEQEDILLDAMDHLTGWCLPKYRIAGD
jgi:hypothetical protein